MLGALEATLVRDDIVGKLEGCVVDGASVGYSDGTFVVGELLGQLEGVAVVASPTLICVPNQNVQRWKHLRERIYLYSTFVW